MAGPVDSSNQDQVEGPSYKQRLDDAADGLREKKAAPPPNPVVEKITQYIPGVSSLLGQDKSPPEEPATPAPGGVPERGTHDKNIEEFVRAQHRSRNEDGKLEGAGSDC